MKMMRHPSLTFEKNDNESFRKSLYYPDSPLTPSSSSSAGLIPEIRITFPDEDVPPGFPGGRTSRVVVVQIGESGAAYITSPPAYEGFQDVETGKVGGLREKC